MKFKNKIILISLVMLVLMSVTCVSATQDADINSTTLTSDSINEEIISSQDSGEIGVQARDAEIENNDSKELEADGGEAISNTF